MLTQTAFRSDAFRRPTTPTHSDPPSNVLDGSSEREPLEQRMHLMGATMSYPRNAEIFGENEPAEYLYKVVSGTVRTYKILSDGRRQIGGFYLPGDIFGLEFADEHTLSAEAITDAKVLVVKRSALDTLASRRCRDCPAALCTYRSRTRSGTGSNPAAHQERAGACRELPFGNGEARAGQQCNRASHVTPGHCRLSRPDDRNRLANAHIPGKLRRDRGADLAANCAAQSYCAEPHEQLSRVRRECCGAIR